MAFMLHKRVEAPESVVSFTIHLKLLKKHRSCPTGGQSQTITTITITSLSHYHYRH